MKHLFYLLSPIIMLLSCCDNNHNNENGLSLSITLNQTDDEINDIAIWVFNNNDVLDAEFYFDSPEALTKDLIQLPEGEYTVVAVTNIKNTFTHNAIPGTTTLQELLITINDPSSSPIHSHFGVAKALLSADEVTRISLLLNRSMAQMQLSIHNTPAEVIKAHLKVLNSSTGYYPGISRLHSESVAVDFGEIILTNGSLVFDDKNIMPVVSLLTRDADTTLKTSMQLTLHYNNGGILSFTLQSPALQNGGIYTPEINYSSLRPSVTTIISPINGWIEQPSLNDEILNPDN